jgi:gliding motility-associated-like protein
LKIKRLVCLLFFTNLIWAQCPPGDVTFNSQADVNTFTNTYPDCDNIAGNLIITGTVNNLSSLDYIKSIEGDLLIRNTQLTTISNFDVLSLVLRTIQITDNNRLTEITGFNALLDLGFYFNIDNNPNLITIEGFNRATDVFGDYWINNNTLLQTVEGFGRLKSIGGFLGFNDCPALNSIPSFNITTFIGWSIQFFNTGLTTIAGFDNLTSIGSVNPTSGFLVSNNQNLISISGFNCLTNIEYDLLIQSNPVLENISGLSSLERVGQFFTIRNNATLTTLNGLQALTVISRTGYETTEVFQIHDNPQLSDCNSLCNLLASNGIIGLTNITDNATGCDTEAEIDTTNCTPLKSINCTSLVSPLNGSIDIELDTAISWLPVTDATSYSISIGTTSEGTQIVNNLNIGNNTTYTLPNNLPANTEIFVKIKPNNAQLQATCCDEESFTTKAVIPECTTLSDPLNGALDVSTQASIHWNPASNATGYVISLGTLSGGRDLIDQLDVGDTTTYIPSFNLPENTSIFVTITPYNTASNSAGCIEEHFVTQSIMTNSESLNIPKFFTPNNDGYNDHWIIEDPLNEIKTVYIYYRSGKLLKAITNIQDGWNGVFNKQIMPVDDYWYVIKLKSGTDVKGHFTLKR